MKNLSRWPEYCGDSIYTVSGSYSQATSWNVSITVYDPHGATSSFTLSTKAKYAGSLTSTRTKCAKHGWQIIGTLTKAAKPCSGHAVEIPVHLGGSWQDVRPRTTSAYGRVAFLALPDRKFKRYVFRLHSRRGSDVRAADSATFRLPRRK